MSRDAGIEECLVCQNVDCKARGSVEVGNLIASRLRAAGSEVRVTPYDCFGACTEGPNIVLYPQGTWYSRATQDDAQAIADHILGGPPVEHLTNWVDESLQGLILGILDSGLGRYYDKSD